MGSLEWISRRNDFEEFSKQQEKSATFKTILIVPTNETNRSKFPQSSPLPPIVDVEPVNEDAGTNIASTADCAQSLLGELRGHTDVVTCCHILPLYIITSSLDETLRLWNRFSLELVAELPCDSPVYTFLCLPLTHKSSKFLLFAATESGKLVAWKVKSSARSGLFIRPTNQFPFHQPNPIRALAVSVDGQLLATGCCFKMHDILPTRRKLPSVRGTLKTWDLAKIVDCSKHPNANALNITHNNMRTMKQLVESRATHQAIEDTVSLGIRALAFTPDGSKLAVGFGNPENVSSQIGSKILVICCARTLTTLWLQDTVNFNINSLEFELSSGQSITEYPVQLLVSTEGKLQKLEVNIDENENQGNSLTNECLNVVWF